MVVQYSISVTGDTSSAQHIDVSVMYIDRVAEETHFVWFNVIQTCYFK